MTSNGFYIGMDLGGTTFKALAVSPDGKVLGRVQDATDATRHRDVVLQSMVDAIHRLQAEVESPAQRLLAVGFGLAGILDLSAGMVRRAPNLPGWDGFDICSALQQRLTVPFSIENDANAAVSAEAWLGAGRGVKHLVMLTLGTGVGGGVIVDGQILHGANGYAGEIGHTVVDPNGPLCGCGSDGCLEQFASGSAIARLAEPYYGKTSAKELALAARRGEPQAIEVYDQVGRYLGIGCASFANLFNPECLIIGGGVTDAFDLFVGSMQTTMRQRTFPEVYDALRIVPATCGPDAGGLGAAYQAMQLVSA